MNNSNRKRPVESLLDAARPGWRERRAKRKSAWNLLNALLIALALGPVGYGLWLCAWRLHIWFYPEHANRLHEFWKAGLSGKAFISSFLMAMPLFVPALVIAALISALCG